MDNKREAAAAGFLAGVICTCAVTALALGVDAQAVAAMAIAVGSLFAFSSLA